MVLQVRCDQRSKMLIFRYTCDKSEVATSLTAAAGFKDSDLGRCYISLLEPLVRASLIGNKYIQVVAVLLEAPIELV